LWSVTLSTSVRAWFRKLVVTISVNVLFGEAIV
jgi:hypothetical protein